MTELTKENFEDEVECADGLVVIDLWAEWCGPCKMIAPMVDELEREIPEAKFCKINVDASWVSNVPPSGGFVVRNHVGTVLRQGHTSFNASSPLQAEAMSLLCCLQQTSDHHKQRLIIESDCLTLVNFLIRTWNVS